MDDERKEHGALADVLGCFEHILHKSVWNARCSV
jgi:hypothetical protein